MLKAVFLLKINKIGKLIARLIKKQRERRTKSTKLEMKMERSQQTTPDHKRLLPVALCQ